MIESLLVVDDGLGATRVVAACHRLGIKAVLLTTSERANLQHGADDVVLLSARELTSPDAVVSAAKAVDVDAVHPAAGPLAGDVRLLEAARAAGLGSMITVTGDVAAGLSAENIDYRPDSAADVEVVVFGAPSGISILGDLSYAGATSLAPADSTEPVRILAHRSALAAGAALTLRGLAVVGVSAAAVTGVRPGLLDGAAAVELAHGVDLVAVQLDAADETRAASGGAASAEVAADAEAPEAARLERYLGADGLPHARLTVRADSATAAAELLAPYLPSSTNSPGAGGSSSAATARSPASA